MSCSFRPLLGAATEGFFEGGGKTEANGQLSWFLFLPTTFHWVPAKSWGWDQEPEALLAGGQRDCQNLGGGIGELEFVTFYWHKETGESQVIGVGINSESASSLPRQTSCCVPAKTH